MRSGPTESDPALGRSSPPIKLSSVDLPEPDGPMSARNSPRAMSTDKDCRTWMRSSPRV
jgi:hypothetical protein